MAFKKLTAGLMASSLILGLAQNAFADITTATPFATAEKMYKLGVVKGVATNPDGTPDFNLGGNLTRAELVTTIVRSFGGEQAAQFAMGAPSFGDVKATDWYSGYIAVAKNIAGQRGVAIGRDANHFDPNANVSKAEALVFVMKFLGVKVDASGANWYEAWIAKAVQMGIITEADAAVALANPGAAATRGEAFVILDFGYSAKVLEGGASLYTAYVDTVKPTVTASAPETTTATKVTVSGKVSDDKAVGGVFVNGKAVAVKDGNFSVEVADLKVGTNSIEVSAVDAAGNTAAQTLKVTRTNADAASIEASDVTVAAGAEVAVSAKLLDANGAEIADSKFEGTSDLGAYADGKFTAGKKAGEGTLTLKSGSIEKKVNVKVVAGDLAGVQADKASAAVGEKVTLTAVDAYGNAVSGATFTQDSADAFLSTNAFVGTKAGSYKITATAGGKTADYTVSVYSATVASFAVTPSVSSVVANNASSFTVTIQARDANKNAISASSANNQVDFDAAASAAFEYKTSAGTWAPLTGYSVSLTNGKATVTLRTAKDYLGGTTQTVKLADHADATLKGSGTVDFVDQVATAVSVEAEGKYIANNDGTGNAYFDIDVLDQDGKKMKSGAFAINVAIAGAGAQLVDTDASGTPANNNPASSKSLFYIGDYSTPGTIVAIARAGYLQTGDVTVTATVTGLTTGSAKVSSVSAFSAAKLQVTADTTDAVTANTQGTITYTLQATDVNGVPVTSGAAFDVAFDITDSEVGQIWTATGAGTPTPLAGKKTTVTLVGGTAKLKVQAFKKVGNVGITFKDQNTGTGTLGQATATAVFKADVAKQIGLTRKADIQLAVSAPEVDLVAQLYDGAGNKVQAAGQSVKFAAGATDTKIDGGTNTKTVTTGADGTATVHVAVAPYVAATGAVSDTVTVTATGLTQKDTYGQVNLVVTNTVASTMSYTLTDNTTHVPVSTAVAGQAIDLAVTVKDAGGRVLPGQSLSVSVDTGSVQEDTIYLNWDAVSQTYKGTFHPTSAGRIGLTVTNSSSATKVTLPVALGVRAAAYNHVRLERADYDVTTVSTSKGVAQAFRLIPVDANDNLAPKTTAGNVTVTWSVSGVDTAHGEYFEIRSSETGASLSTINIAPGANGSTFYVLTNAANASVTFSGTGVGGDTTIVFQAK